MPLLMASTVSFQSDSLISRIDLIFLFVVAWKRERKVDGESLERALFLAPFYRGYHSASVYALVVASSHFPRFLEKTGLQNCFAR